MNSKWTCDGLRPRDTYEPMGISQATVQEYCRRRGLRPIRFGFALPGDMYLWCGGGPNEVMHYTCFTAHADKPGSLPTLIVQRI